MGGSTAYDMYRRTFHSPSIEEVICTNVHEYSLDDLTLASMDNKLSADELNNNHAHNAHHLEPIFSTGSGRKTPLYKPKVRFERTPSTPYHHKPLGVQIGTCFSLLRNTRQMFQHDPSRVHTLDTVRLILILFFFISNAYYYTLIFAPMIVKRFYVLGPLQFVQEKKYFFIRMYYVLGCLYALR